MPLDVSKAPTSASPLWVIALFIALSEATAGAAAITTNGTARLIFACFAVAFPTLVFGIFVWLLVKHAPKLYAPGQYSKEITPEVYRIGISRADSLFLGRAVAQTVVPLLGDTQGKSHEETVEQVARRFEVAVEESSITISLSDLKPDAGSLQIPVSKETQIQPLLNEIFFELAPAVAAGTYGREWILVDENGTEYPDMGLSWAADHNIDRDLRTITEVGILPGTRLTAMAKAWPTRRRR